MFILGFIREYLLNFFIWWYYVQNRVILGDLISRSTFMLSFLNLIPMISNFFSPLYQDYSFIGIVIALPFRFFALSQVAAYLFYTGYIPCLLIFSCSGNSCYRAGFG
jgi:hypothetical protein